MQNYLDPILLPGRGVKRSLHCRVLQSPLAGVSDQVFRRLVRRWAPEALIFIEMVSASRLNKGQSKRKIEEFSQEIGPIGVQLFDNQPEGMAKAAQKAERAGAFLIDINMGCPVKKIARKGGGSALLKNHDLAAKIVSTVSNAVKIPVTVKTRLGWCEKSSEPVDFALRLQSAGAQLITLHGRTRDQGFRGKANWHVIAEVKQALNIPVIANGDINSVEDAARCLELTGADGIMIGRGSMGAPWLVGQIDAALKGYPAIETPCVQHRVQLLLEQIICLLELKGDHGLLIARKHMKWSCKGFTGATSLRNSLLQAETPAEAISLLENKINSTKEFTK